MRKVLIAGCAVMALAVAGCQSGAGGYGSGAAPEAAAASVLLQSAMPGGARLVERVERKGDEIVIPYEKFVLPNGLTVILHEDKSDPLVHVDVTYHVGSGREEVGKSGFAHFFEHMMFQGSQNVGDEQHFKIVSEAGGTLNGTTNSDRTNYFETVPSNQLEKVLWLEADRMGFLLPAVTQEKFEVQRETVKNERGQRVDNAPYGLLSERVGEAMYPSGHPYSWSTIGYIEDLNRADLDDLKRFFLRWYGPNNAVLTIGGSFDRQQALEWVAKYFGPIPSGPAASEPQILPVSLDADRYLSLEDNVSLPLLYMAWPTVHARHPDEAALDVLASILGQGRTSLLYKNLVKGGLAVQANSGHGCRELHCTLTMTALPNPGGGKSLAELEAIMRASFSEFETRGVTDDDLARVKADIVSGLIFRLESVSGKVSQLAAYETFANDPNYVAKELASYEKLTKADVQRVYERYIKGKPAVIMSIVPKGRPQAVARPDTWRRPERVIPASTGGDGALALREPKDSFDRSSIPAAGPNPALSTPPIWRSALANGVPVLGAVNSETPTTAVSIRIRAGQRNESMEKLGLASLTASMLGEATQLSTNEALANRLEKLGSSISVGSDDDYTIITVRSLTKNLDETLAIAAERLFKPAFAEADFNRLKAQTLEGIRLAQQQPPAIADLAFDLVTEGRDNPASYSDAGQTSTVAKLTLADVKSFYETYMTAANASVVAVTDLSEAALLQKLGATFGAWAAKPAPAVKDAPLPKIAGTTLYFVHKDGAAQSEIRIGTRSLPFDATGEFYRAGLMSFPLGGAFNSRINLNLRENKGYTYGARAGFSGSERYGFYTAAAGVRQDATKESILEFLKEIDGFRAGGVTAEELSFTKSARGQSDALRYETPGQKLGLLGLIQRYNLPNGFLEQQSSILKGLTKAQVDALAAKLLPNEDKVIVVVGDRSKVFEGLKTLGYPIVELAADGAPLKK
jgi:zinc protease